MRHGGILVAAHHSLLQRVSGAEEVGQVFEAISSYHHCRQYQVPPNAKTHWAKTFIIQSISCQLGRHRGRLPSSPLPALYILQETYRKKSAVTFASLYRFPAGRCTGHSFPYPFHQIFRERHARQVSLPRATATTQVLVSGERAEASKTITHGWYYRGPPDFIVATFGWWNGNFTTRVCTFGEMLAEKPSWYSKVNTGAAVLGLGYIVGLKYASIICAGSLARMVDYHPRYVHDLGRFPY